MGLELRNPIIAASCGLTNSVANIKKLAGNGIGAIVIKSMFEEQINIETEKYIKDGEGNVKTLLNAPDNLTSKRIYDYNEAYSYIYDYAHNNTLDRYLAFINEAKNAVDVPIIVSINCISDYNWYSFAKKIQDAGADAIELNIYILPSDFRRTAEENEKIYFEIIKDVRKYVTIPVSIKIGYYFTSLAQSVQRLSESGIAGMVLFNRPYNTDIDINTIEVVPGKIYSSEQEYVHTLRWVSILSERVKCDISAATGIHNYETAIKMLLAGADTVQIASEFYKSGFEIIPGLLNDITGWMKKHGFESVTDFRGKLSKANIANPAALERVQFMKHYSGIE